MLYSLKTHPELFASAESGEAGHAPWPMGLLATLAGVTVLVALVSETVESAEGGGDVGDDPSVRRFTSWPGFGKVAKRRLCRARKNRLT